MMDAADVGHDAQGEDGQLLHRAAREQVQDPEHAAATSARRRLRMTSGLIAGCRRRAHPSGRPIEHPEREEDPALELRDPSDVLDPTDHGVTISTLPPAASTLAFAPDDLAAVDLHRQVLRRIALAKQLHRACAAPRIRPFATSAALSDRGAFAERGERRQIHRCSTGFFSEAILEAALGQTPLSWASGRLRRRGASRGRPSGGPAP